MKKFLTGLIIVIVTIIIIVPSLLIILTWGRTAPVEGKVIIITQVISVLFLILSITLACKRSIVNKWRKIIVVSLLFGLSIGLWWVSSIIMMTPGR